MNKLLKYFMKQNKKTIIFIVGVVLLVGLSFWGGRMTALRSRKNLFSQMGARGQMGIMGQGGLRNGQTNQRGIKPSESRIMGQIEKIEDKQLVIKTIDGSTKMIMISDSTAFKKMASSSLNDIAVGQNAVVNGIQNSGVTIANSIEISGE